MKVIILAGGYGTRMIEETANIPKPMVEINGKPLIWYIMQHYAFYGFNDFIIAAGYKMEKLKEYFLNLRELYSDFTIDIRSNNSAQSKVNYLNSTPDWKVTVLDTGLNTMTGGRIKRIASHIDGDEFMLTYGDGVTDLNIKALLEFHRSHGGKATLTAVRLPRFGMLNLEGEKVTSFQEKRLGDSPYINGGFMVLNKSVIDYIEGDKIPFETTPLQRLAEEGSLYAYRYEGFWKCVDTLRDKKELEEYLKCLEI